MNEDTSPLGLGITTDQHLSTRCRAQLDFNAGTGINVIDDLYTEVTGILTGSQSEEDTTLKKENIQLQNKIKVLENKLIDMESVAGTLIERQQEIIKLHQEITETGNFLGGVLSLAERNAIKEEIKKAKRLYSFGMRDQGVYLAEIFDPNLFHRLRCDLKRECPTLSNILEQLVLSPNAIRGWRLADIDGLQELFRKKETALDPQQDISELEFKDICIGNDNLQTIAETAEEAQGTKKYKIDIPPVQDFPHLSKNQTKIYPLPISHENQCTILGTASNLDLFASEFGFSNERNTKKNFVSPSAKEFDLDKAYERHSFLKSYEKHKETQQEYEATLRMQQDAFVNSTEYVPEFDDGDVLLHVFDDETSSSEDEIE
ncbi:hypothetical protein AC249_AIPGENE16621 [Exaiptasia diaphana]|nr:hypothetical protein AC249_AIPGENE16621 [Exaiptasia diaphana]